MNSFKEDLKLGHYYEKICSNHFNIVEWEPDIKNSGYDFIIEENMEEIKIECKSDRIAYKSGNICIETECRGKLSGLSITQSVYYVYFIITPNGYNIYKIPVQLLKKSIVNSKSYYGGDGKQSKFHLLKLKDFQNYLVK